jgi:hypothetical protein
MATQINGKLYRNVKGEMEGIVTTDLKIVNTSGETVTKFDQGNESLQVNTLEDIGGTNAIQLSDENEGISIVSSDNDVSLSAPESDVKISGQTAVISCPILLPTSGQAIHGESTTFHIGYNGGEASSPMLTFDEDEGLIIIDQYLPTEDPEVAGALWNDNGTLKISAGE